MRSKHGFTLMEMMVALVMAAVVISPLYIITRGVAETSSSKQMDVEAMQRARVGMDLLVRDFSRAGLFTSPNTALDPRYFNREVPNSNVRYRSAVSHLNRNSGGSDIVMLTGNFLGSSTYNAFAESTSQLQIVGTTSSDECLEQFSSNYSVVQIADNSGRMLEARITSVQHQSGRCQLQIDNADYHTDSFQNGDTVRIAANQTALYMIEGLDLVRYFVQYSANAGAVNGGDCGHSSEVDDYSDIQLDGTVVPGTRKVLATYVTDFQVWFRAATYSATTGWTLPHYHGLTNVIAQKNGNYADGLKLPPAMHLIPLSASGTVNDEDVSCESFDPGTSFIGPERVRSAMIQLTVRTEKSDGAVRWGFEDTDSPGRLVRQTIAPDDSITMPDGQPQFVYQLKTLTTEVEMPNLAARNDLLAL